MIQVIALNEQSDVERPEQVSVTLPHVPTDTPHIKVVAHAEHWPHIGRLVSQSILNTERHSSLPASLILPRFLLLFSWLLLWLRYFMKLYQLLGLRSS